MQSTETWLPVPGYEGFYAVSDHGRIRSEARTDIRGQRRGERIRKPNVTARGHLIAHLHRDRVVTARPVAHYVLEVFTGPCPAGQEAIHLDGDRANNALDNLMWGRRTARPDQYNAKVCLLEGCDRKSRARGYCEPHARRIRLYGDPFASAPRTTTEERFWSRVRPTGFCWEWIAGHDSNGYGVFNPRKGHAVRAHRFSYELLVAPIPEGLHIDHLCRNRNCVNPDHLEPVTPAENTRRELAVRRIGR